MPDNTMDLESEQTIKLIQANMMLGLNDCIERQTPSSLNKRFSKIIFFINEIHSKVSEETLEIILFKSFIGELSMKKIVFELFKGN
jgi:hypothetical protein